MTSSTAKEEEGQDERAYQGPFILNVGVRQKQEAGRRAWRQAWRDRVIPNLVAFNPDLILISAGLLCPFFCVWN